jgi:hypothetical protein
MFRPIRIRAEFAEFCPYNMPLRFANHTPGPLVLQWVRRRCRLPLPLKQQPFSV